jgi:hypothetical protein
METKEIFKGLLALIFLFFLVSPYPGAWVKEEGAIEALKKQGFTEITITERDNYFISFRGGGSGDEARFVCKAKNPSGETVEDIYVYGGWPFKSYTVRY